MTRIAPRRLVASLALLSIAGWYVWTFRHQRWDLLFWCCMPSRWVIALMIASAGLAGAYLAS